MQLCSGCDNACNLFDNIEKKELMYHCNKCDIYSEMNSNIVFKRNFNKVYEKHFNKMILKDPSLPKNMARQCGKCHKNNVVYTRNDNLTLNYYCVDCETTI